jgi:hypothetical protein
MPIIWTDMARIFAETAPPSSLYARESAMSFRFERYPGE